MRNHGTRAPKVRICVGAFYCAMLDNNIGLSTVVLELVAVRVAMGCMHEGGLPIRILSCKNTKIYLYVIISFTLYFFECSYTQPV